MAIASDLIISSDSHVMEPVDLWKKGVPEKYREAAPLFPPHQVGEGFQQHAGGWDPNARMKEMDADGLSADRLSTGRLSRARRHTAIPAWAGIQRADRSAAAHRVATGTRPVVRLQSRA